ncbi:MAG: hypothetical protein KY475_16695 [Planctomycetes bacterium]|nr:hypothetical protein [Planctomycetota bacterium]
MTRIFVISAALLAGCYWSALCTETNDSDKSVRIPVRVGGEVHFVTLEYDSFVQDGQVVVELHQQPQRIGGRPVSIVVADDANNPWGELSRARQMVSRARRNSFETGRNWQRAIKEPNSTQELDNAVWHALKDETHPVKVFRAILEAWASEEAPAIQERRLQWAHELACGHPEFGNPMSEALTIARSRNVSGRDYQFTFSQTLFRTRRLIAELVRKRAVNADAVTRFATVRPDEPDLGLCALALLSGSEESVRFWQGWLSAHPLRPMQEMGIDQIERFLDELGRRGIVTKSRFGTEINAQLIGLRDETQSQVSHDALKLMIGISGDQDAYVEDLAKLFHPE